MESLNDTNYYIAKKCKIDEDILLI